MLPLSRLIAFKFPKLCCPEVLASTVSRVCWYQLLISLPPASQSPRHTGRDCNCPGHWSTEHNESLNLHKWKKMYKPLRKTHFGWTFIFNVFSILFNIILWNNKYNLWPDHIASLWFDLKKIVFPLYITTSNNLRVQVFC